MEVFVEKPIEELIKDIKRVLKKASFNRVSVEIMIDEPETYPDDEFHVTITGDRAKIEVTDFYR